MGLARLWEAIRQLGRRRGQRRRQQKGAGPRRPHREQTGYLDPGSFVRAVKRMSATEDGRRARLHVFSLTDFRTAVGNKWERLERLVSIAKDNIIRRHIQSGTDIFTHLDAETSLLAMPHTPRKEARAQVAGIARDLADYLFGDAVVAGRRPQVVAANLPLEKALTPAGTLDEAAVRNAIAEAGAALQAEAPAISSSALHRAALASLLDNADIVPPQDGTGNGGEEPGWLDLHLRRRTEEALAGRQPLRPDTALSLSWTPTWTAARQAVAAFHAHIVRRDGEHGTTMEGSQAYADATPIGALTIDRFAATGTARELRDLAFEHQEMPAVLPVYWSSLAPRWRDYLLTALDDVPKGTRQKYLKIEVTGLPVAMAPAEIDELLQPLARLDCAVLLRLPMAAFHALPPLGPPVRAVGVDLAELDDADKAGDDTLYARLENCRRAAVRARLNCYVWGVRRQVLILRLARAGFDMVNGPGLMANLGHPYVPQVRRTN